MLTSEGDKRVSSGEVVRCEVTIGYRVLLLSQSLDNLGTTRGECLGRTRWSSLLDSTTYLYYFTSGCTPITTWSHVPPEHSTVTWPCHVVWLSNFPCYLYLNPIVRLDIRDQMYKCVGNSFLSGALITWIYVLQMVTYLVCDGLRYRFKELISRVRQATKDVVKSEV